MDPFKRLIGSKGGGKRNPDGSGQMRDGVNVHGQGADGNFRQGDYMDQFGVAKGHGDLDDTDFTGHIPSGSKRMDREEAIGIDLGGSFACAAVYQNRKIEIIQNERGNRKTPCCIAYTDNGIYKGESAAEQGKRNIQNTLFGAKRFLGAKTESIDAITRNETLPFILKSQNSEIFYETVQKKEIKRITPKDVSVMVLKQMKETAEKFLGKTVTMAVVSVPSHFTSEQRKLTKEACKEAGMEPLDVINEPTAAVIGYTVDKEVQAERVFLVFDLGGSKLNVSIIKVSQQTYTVKATEGDSQLGGEQFNSRLFNHFAAEILKNHKINIRENPKSVVKLIAACEKAKKELSISKDVSFEVDALINGEDYPLQINRDKFEKLNEDLFEKTKQCVENVLLDANFKAEKINNVLLVGGSTRIPKIQLLLGQIFKSSQIKTGINADEAVAYGAAVKAITRTNPFISLNLRIEDISPFTYVINHGNDCFQHIFERNTLLKNATRDISFSLGKNKVLEIEIYKMSSSDLLPQPKDISSIVKLKDNNSEEGKYRFQLKIDEDGIFSHSKIEDKTEVEDTPEASNEKGRPETEMNWPRHPRSAEMSQIYMHRDHHIEPGTWEYSPFAHHQTSEVSDEEMADLFETLTLKYTFCENSEKNEIDKETKEVALALIGSYEDLLSRNRHTLTRDVFLRLKNELERKLNSMFPTEQSRGEWVDSKSETSELIRAGPQPGHSNSRAGTKQTATDSTKTEPKDKNQRKDVLQQIMKGHKKEKFDYLCLYCNSILDKMKSGNRDPLITEAYTKHYKNFAPILSSGIENVSEKELDKMLKKLGAK